MSPRSTSPKVYFSREPKTRAPAMIVSCMEPVGIVEFAMMKLLRQNASTAATAMTFTQSMISPSNVVGCSSSSDFFGLRFFPPAVRTRGDAPSACPESLLTWAAP